MNPEDTKEKTFSESFVTSLIETSAIREVELQDKHQADFVCFADALSMMNGACGNFSHGFNMQTEKLEIAEEKNRVLQQQLDAQRNKLINLHRTLESVLQHSTELVSEPQGKSNPLESLTKHLSDVLEVKHHRKLIDSILQDLVWLTE